MAGRSWNWKLGTTAFAVVLLCHCSRSLASDTKSPWGNLPDEVSNRAVPMNSEPHNFDPETSPWVEQVGDAPKVFYFHNFLTDAERTHMIQLAVPYMKRSTVVGAGGAGVVDDVRTSHGTFLRRLIDPIVANIEKRISMWTHIPIEHQEDIQVLRYQQGQTYRAHYDSSYDKKEFGPKFRLCTFLMYLSDVEEGGETAFPQNSVYTDPEIPKRGGPWSECAKGNVAAKPKKNDAVLFYSYHANGTMDPASMHTGCPVLKGVKWAAPVWIHVDEFRPEEMNNARIPRSPFLLPDPGVCADHQPTCAEWVAKGECEKNRGFMLDTCRKSCKECEMCGDKDYDCINRNRKRGGYLQIDRDEMKKLGVDVWQTADPSPEL